MDAQLFVFRNEYNQEVYPIKTEPMVFLWKMVIETGYARIVYGVRPWWWLGLNFDWAKIALHDGTCTSLYTVGDIPDNLRCKVIHIKDVLDDPIVQEAMNFHKVFTLEELLDCYWIDCLIKTGEGHQELLDPLYVREYERVSNNGTGRFVALFVQNQLQKGQIRICFSESEKWRVVNTRDGYVSIDFESRTRRRRIDEFYPEICQKVDQMVSGCGDLQCGCCFCIEIIGVDASMRLGRQRDID